MRTYFAILLSSLILSASLMSMEQQVYIQLTCDNSSTVKAVDSKEWDLHVSPVSFEGQDISNFLASLNLTDEDYRLLSQGAWHLKKFPFGKFTYTVEADNFKIKAIKKAENITYKITYKTNVDEIKITQENTCSKELIENSLTHSPEGLAQLELGILLAQESPRFRVLIPHLRDGQKFVVIFGGSKDEKNIFSFRERKAKDIER